MPQLFRLICVCCVAVICCLCWLSSVSAQETWTPLGLSSNSVMCIAVAPGNSSLLVVGGINLYVSTNGGSTWTTTTAPTAVWTVVFGSTQNVAFAGSWGGGVYKSTDGCATWTQKNSGLTNAVVKSIYVSPTDDNTVYACA